LQARLQERAIDFVTLLERHQLPVAAGQAITDAVRSATEGDELRGFSDPAAKQELRRIGRAAEDLSDLLANASPFARAALDWNGIGIQDGDGVRSGLPALWAIIRLVADRASLAERNFRPSRKPTQQIRWRTKAFIWHLVRWWTEELSPRRSPPSVSGRHIDGGHAHGENEGARFIREAFELVYEEPLPIRTLDKVLKQWRAKRRRSRADAISRPERPKRVRSQA
jgi:hypothetical protein